MDSQLPDINKFLRDEAKDNLIIYEVKFNFFQWIIFEKLFQ
jgi:hypothetical protein